MERLNRSYSTLLGYSVRNVCGEGEVGSWLVAHWFREMPVPPSVLILPFTTRTENSFYSRVWQNSTLHLGFLGLQTLGFAHGNFWHLSFPGMYRSEGHTHCGIESTCACESVLKPTSGFLHLYSILPLTLSDTKVLWERFLLDSFYNPTLAGQVIVSSSQLWETNSQWYPCLSDLWEFQTLKEGSSLASASHQLIVK